MSKYTTGEVAKLCGISVRTVQYYDTRGLLVPNELSEGGRRIYSENDLKRMKIICFLRNIGLPINSIGDLLKSENAGEVIELLLDEHKKLLEREVEERRQKLDILEIMRGGIKGSVGFSVETIGDIAVMMKDKNKLKRLHILLLVFALPLGIVQWGSIALWIIKGVWWPFALWLAVLIPYALLLSRWYMRRVEYICPHCHKVFKPGFREELFAAHTPKLRKLRCTHCGEKNYCVEIYKETGK